MESKTPVRLHDRLSDNLGVLHSHILGRWPSDEVEIKNTAKGIVLEELAVGVVDLDVHAVGAEEEDTVGARRAAVVEVDGVVSIQVRSTGDTVCITVP